jgi:hypothetical protein
MSPSIRLLLVDDHTPADHGHKWIHAAQGNLKLAVLRGALHRVVHAADFHGLPGGLGLQPNGGLAGVAAGLAVVAVCGHHAGRGFDASAVAGQRGVEQRLDPGAVGVAPLALGQQRPDEIATRVLQVEGGESRLKHQLLDGADNCGVFAGGRLGPTRRQHDGGDDSGSQNSDRAHGRCFHVGFLLEQAASGGGVGLAGGPAAHQRNANGPPICAALRRKSASSRTR